MGDLEAARRLAVIWLEPASGFVNNGAAISEALFGRMRHLQFELVHSGIGAAYVRFQSHDARELAMQLVPIMHEDVRISFEREEEAQRVLVLDDVCALFWASPLAAENTNPAGIIALFSGFGKVLEIGRAHV